MATSLTEVGVGLLLQLGGTFPLMPIGEVEATPKQLLVGLLVALGVLTVVRDLLSIAERLRLADELRRDPEGPARAAEEILREEEGNDVERD